MDAILSALQFIHLQFVCHRLMLFGSYTHSRASIFFLRYLSEPKCPFEARATRQLVGGPVLAAGGGLEQWFFDPVTRQLMEFYVSIKPDQSSTKCKACKASYIIYFKDRVNCSIISSCFPSWFLSSFRVLSVSSCPL